MTMPILRPIRSTRRRPFVSALTVAAFAAFAACSSDSTGPDTSTPPSIELEASSLTDGVAGLPVQATTSFTLTVTRSAGYTGTVTLAADQTASGFTVRITPTQLEDPDSVASVDIVIPANTPAGSYPFRFRATGPNVDPVTVSVTLSVQGPS